MSGVPYIFANATTSIPLSQLDVNFSTPVTIGNTTVALGNTVTSFGNVTLTNTTISSGNATLTSVVAPTIGSASGSSLSLQSNGTTNATLDTNGSLFINKTSASSNSGVGIQLYHDTSGAGASAISVVDSASTNTYNSHHLYSTGAGAYRFYVGYGGTVYATSIVISAISDQRLKENVRDLDLGLSAINSLKPRRFDWKEGKGQDKKNAVGFIAQEFQTVFPDSISTFEAGNDGIEYLTMNHEELIPSLVKAIQELSVQVTTLQSQVTALQAKVGT